MNLSVWSLIILIIATFIPRYGILALYKDWRRAKEREQVEDALKHLLDREQSGRHASPKSLAGTLDLSRTKANSSYLWDGSTGSARNTRLTTPPHCRRNTLGNAHRPCAPLMGAISCG